MEEVDEFISPIWHNKAYEDGYMFRFLVISAWQKRITPSLLIVIAYELAHRTMRVFE